MNLNERHFVWSHGVGFEAAFPVFLHFKKDHKLTLKTLSKALHALWSSCIMQVLKDPSEPPSSYSDVMYL